jgi:hypothetical protein
VAFRQKYKPTINNVGTHANPAQNVGLAVRAPFLRRGIRADRHVAPNLVAVAARNGSNRISFWSDILTVGKSPI